MTAVVSVSPVRAGDLLLRRDVDPVLDQDDAMIDELLLELADFGIGSLPVLLGRTASEIRRPAA
jgi:hypothetical protein